MKRNLPVAVIAFAVLMLTGCAVGRPLGFTGRSDSFCGDALKSIAGLHTPTTTRDEMRYAMDRYTAMEKVVSELTDSSLPGAATGNALRDRWLRPARASLLTGRGVLNELQRAVTAGDIGTAAPAFAATAAIGTANVDTRLLAAQGLTNCAKLFTAPRA